MIGPVVRPQWIAGALLLVFLGQCAWLVSRSLHTREMDLREWYRLDTGLRRSHSSPRPAAIPDPHCAFGTIFTGIAVAHTLYAPREVILWNWRRTLLLGVSLALAVACQFSLAILAPFTLAFMLYLAPTRRAAALIIWSAACALALILL